MENKKLIFTDHVLEHKSVVEVLKERGIDIEAHPNRYKIEYEDAMDDGYDYPISSYSVYEITSQNGVPYLYRPFPENTGNDYSDDTMKKQCETRTSEIPDSDYTNRNDTLEEQKGTKVIRVTKKIKNNASRLLAVSALATALTAPIGFVNTYCSEAVYTSVPIQKVVTTESNVYDSISLHDSSNVGAGVDFFEIGNRSAKTAKVGSNSWNMPGNYEISGFAIYDENNRLVESFVDLNRSSYDVNLGSSISKICERNGLDASKATVAIHLGSEVDGSTLGWFAAKDILGPNALVRKSEVVTSYETRTTMTKKVDDKVLDYSMDHVTPAESIFAAGLATVAAASAFATRQRNKKNEKSPLYKEFNSESAFIEWENKEYRVAAEEYRKKSLFEKLKSKLFSKKAVIQSLSNDQKKELYQKVLGKYDLDNASVAIRDDGHFIINSYATTPNYVNGGANVGINNEVVDSLPLTEGTENLISDIENVSTGRSM